MRACLMCLAIHAAAIPVPVPTACPGTLAARCRAAATFDAPENSTSRIESVICDATARAVFPVWPSIVPYAIRALIAPHWFWRDFMWCQLKVTQLQGPCRVGDGRGKARRATAGHCLFAGRVRRAANVLRPLQDGCPRRTLEPAGCRMPLKLQGRRERLSWINFPGRRSVY